MFGTSLIHIRLTKKQFTYLKVFHGLIYFVTTITIIFAPTSKPILYITTKDIIYSKDKYCVP
jgi:hypothetical protein